MLYGNSQTKFVGEFRNAGGTYRRVDNHRGSKRGQNRHKNEVTTGSTFFAKPPTKPSLMASTESNARQAHAPAEVPAKSRTVGQSRSAVFFVLLLRSNRRPRSDLSSLSHQQV